MSTKIEWTDETWNPVTGCAKVSEGCRNCYAETIAKRFWGDRKFTEVRCHEDRLDQPLRWRKPRQVFVNSMSDLFHPDVPFAFVAAVWTVMAGCPQHTFQILTKRPDRMADAVRDLCAGAMAPPLSNVWLGVSVEDQATADERIPLLLQTPAAVRFVSCEPLLGPVDLTHCETGDHRGPLGSWCDPLRGTYTDSPTLDWVICGGESGHGARPMHPDWARSLRDQCVSAGVPFLFKQWGEWVPCGMVEDETAHRQQVVEGMIACRVGKAAAGRELDGRTWDEFPERSVDEQA